MTTINHNRFTDLALLDETTPVTIGEKSQEHEKLKETTQARVGQHSKNWKLKKPTLGEENHAGTNLGKEGKQNKKLQQNGNMSGDIILSHVSGSMNGTVDSIGPLKGGSDLVGRNTNESVQIDLMEEGPGCKVSGIGDVYGPNSVDMGLEDKNNITLDNKAFLKSDPITLNPTDQSPLGKSFQILASKPSKITPTSNKNDKNGDGLSEENSDGLTDSGGGSIHKGDQRIGLEFQNGNEYQLMGKREAELNPADHCGPTIGNHGGTGNENFRNNFRELVVVHSPDIVFLLETRVAEERAISISTRLGFSGVCRAPTVGGSGGIWMLWRREEVKVEVIDMDQQAIHAIIAPKLGQDWLCSGVYAKPNPSERESFWNKLETLSTTNSLPWLVTGDFNEVANISEKRGRRLASAARCRRFKEMMDTCGFMDLGYRGPKFTWFNSSNGLACVRERLDRSIANVAWQECFPESLVLHLPRTHSDHHPLLTLCNGLDRPRARRPFRFELAWFTDPQCKEIVEQVWNSTNSIYEAIDQLPKMLKEWNKCSFGNIFFKKRRILARLNGIQKRLCCEENQYLSDLEDELIREYNLILKQEELLWFQKSRVKWLVEGDRNTKFYHMTTVCRRRNNKVVALKIDGEWQTDDAILRDHVRGYFLQLFQQHNMNESAPWAVKDPLCNLVEGDIRGEETDWSVAEILGNDGQWLVEKIKTKLPPVAIEAIHNTPIPWQRDKEDKIIWGDWVKPDKGWFKVNTDESVLVEKKSAAAGGVIRDDEGVWIRGFSRNLGDVTITVAELLAAREGLSLAWERRLPCIILELDSEVVVKLIRHADTSQHPLGAVIEDCRRLLGMPWESKIVHTKRSGNACADALAKLGHSIGREGHSWDSPPHEVLQIFLG
ncbi:hypothetical protein RD792_011700, partial [Penstemon davidsonii]